MLEIPGSPSAEDMRAHAFRLQSHQVLKHAISKDPEALADSQFSGRVARLRETMQVNTDGPFLTIAVKESRASAVEMADAVAKSFADDLAKQQSEPERRAAQARAARITAAEPEVEKARLELLDLSRRYGIAPDGRSPVLEAGGRELGERLARARLDLAVAEGRLAALRDKDAGKAMAALAALPGKYADNVRVNYANLQAARIAAADKDNPEAPAAAAEVAEYERNFRQSLAQGIVAMESEARQHATEVVALEAASARHQQDLLKHLQQSAEVDAARTNLERQTRALEELRRQAVAVSPAGPLPAVRIIEQAHGAKLPDPRARRRLRLGVVVSAWAVGSLLLFAIASRLRRRC